MGERRYYWLKLQQGFFDQTHIKALRRQDNGADKVVVYLKLMLKCLNTDCYYRYEGVLPEAPEEIALALDEDKNIVKSTIDQLIQYGCIRRLDEKELFIEGMSSMIGSECESAARVRKFRERQAGVQTDSPLQCNTEKEKIKDKDKEKDTMVLSFDEIWRHYPRPDERNEAEIEYNYLLDKGFDPKDLLQAVKMYAAECHKKRTPMQYIKLGKNFFGKDNYFDEYLEEKF